MVTVEEHLENAAEELSSLRRATEQCSIAFIDAFRHLNGELAAAISDDMTAPQTIRLQVILDQRHRITADFMTRCEIKVASRRHE